MAERGGNGTLVAGLGRHQLQDKPLARLRQRASCGRQALPLGQGVLEGRQPLGGKRRGP